MKFDGKKNGVLYFRDTDGYLSAELSDTQLHLSMGWGGIGSAHDIVEFQCPYGFLGLLLFTLCNVTNAYVEVADNQEGSSQHRNKIGS